MLNNALLTPAGEGSIVPFRPFSAICGEGSAVSQDGERLSSPYVALSRGRGGAGSLSSASAAS
ncbi:hypothetical protein KCP70_09265 [Salmonella enterica subsp. enterica]|nr:hypothetical protein KCP70_09265 [Salmonella enterica subsp. enterica]